jgi:hypothetical protein
MPPLNRTMSRWTWFVIFDVAVSLGLVAGAGGTLAQPAPSAGEIGMYRLYETPSDTSGLPRRLEQDEQGDRRASASPIANGHKVAAGFEPGDVGRSRTEGRSLVPGRGASF